MNYRWFPGPRNETRRTPARADKPRSGPIRGAYSYTWKVPKNLGPVA